MSTANQTASVIVAGFHKIFGLSITPKPLAETFSEQNVQTSDGSNSFIIPVSDVKETRDKVTDFFNTLIDSVKKMNYGELLDLHKAVESTLTHHTVTLNVQRENGDIYGSYSMHPLLKMVQIASLAKRAMQVNDALTHLPQADYDVEAEFGDNYPARRNVTRFFGNPTAEKQQELETKSPTESFTQYIARGADVDITAKADPISKEMLLENPAIIAETFERYLAEAGDDMSKIVRGTMIAEAICDRALQKLTLPELRQVYLDYVSLAPNPEDAKPENFEVLFHVKHTDYYKIGIREIQSNIATDPEVKPHLNRGAIMMDGFMVPTDYRIQHLISSLHGGYYTGFTKAMDAAIAGEVPTQRNQPSGNKIDRT